METISNFIGSNLYWVQPKTFERRFELRAEQSILATLTFHSEFGTLATAEVDRVKWTYKRVGFLNPRVTVREVGSEANLAVYQPRFWGDGTLSFALGATFHWKPVNFWATDWAFMDSTDKVLLAFKPGSEKSKLSDIFKTQAALEIEPLAASLAQLPLLATLGWYLLILHQEDAAATATTASTAALT